MCSLMNALKSVQFSIALYVALLISNGNFSMIKFSKTVRCPKCKCTAIENITYNVHGAPHMGRSKIFYLAKWGGRQILDLLDKGDHKISMVDFAQFF